MGQIRAIEGLGEGPVYLVEEGARLRLVSASAPQTREVRHRPKLPEPCSLRARNDECPLEAGFGLFVCRVGAAAAWACAISGCVSERHPLVAHANAAAAPSRGTKRPRPASSGRLTVARAQGARLWELRAVRTSRACGALADARRRRAPCSTRYTGPSPRPSMPGSDPCPRVPRYVSDSARFRPRCRGQLPVPGAWR